MEREPGKEPDHRPYVERFVNDHLAARYAGSKGGKRPEERPAAEQQRAIQEWLDQHPDDE